MAANIILVSQYGDGDEPGKQREWRNKGMKPEGRERENMRTKRQSERTMSSPNSGKSHIFLGTSFSRTFEECLGGSSVLPEYCWWDSTCIDCTSNSLWEMIQKEKSTPLPLSPSGPAAAPPGDVATLQIPGWGKATLTTLYCTKPFICSL